jgi:Luciferase-like monooxygenase
LTDKPAVALATLPGRRNTTIELAKEIESRGFSGIYCASIIDNMGLCLSLAHETTTIEFGTAIARIYTRHAFDMAASAAHIHEISGGRFRMGIGVSHGSMNAQLGIQAGKPLVDTRRYVEQMRAAEQQVGELPPFVLATLRKKMVALSGEISEGAVWANAACSHMESSLSVIPDRPDNFFVGNMLPTCIDDDKDAAAQVMKRNLTMYLGLPNYRNYWKEAGYIQEMEAVEQALDAGEQDALPGLMSDRWLNDCTLHGSASEVSEGVERWYAASVNTPILVPLSTSGGQRKAFEEIFAAFS